MLATQRTQTGSSSRQKPWLEIIPESRFVVFQGNENESPPVKLAGVVRFHTPEAIDILKPKVWLHGKRQMHWFYLDSSITATPAHERKTFFTQEQKLGMQTTHKLQAGTIEWPFELELDPSMAESVEGLPGRTYIVYHLRASVARPGWSTRDIFKEIHVRIVRIFGQDFMGLPRSRMQADVWANKVSYHVSIPTDVVVFGTSVTANFELSPLRKGVRMGKIELRFIETVVKRILADDVPSARCDRSKLDEIEILRHDMDFPEDSKITYEETSADNPIMADEMYKFHATVMLPKSLKHCRQDVDLPNVKITHQFRIMVNILNPEGHVSQLICRLPVKLFISPQLPLDESNHVYRAASVASNTDLNSTEDPTPAPPQYGLHQLDHIYSAIDTSDFQSRVGSGSETPASIQAQSRRSSQENNIPVNGLIEVAPSHGSATPHLLRSRLTDLQANGSSHAVQAGHQDNPPSHSHEPTGRSNSSFADSMESSPSTSAPSGQTANAMQAMDYNLEHLNRVPSYGAALRTSGPTTPFNQGPPSYFEAISRPASPSPTAAAATGARTELQIQRPDAAHVRGGAVSSPPRPRSLGSQSSQETLTTTQTRTQRNDSGHDALATSSSDNSPAITTNEDVRRQMPRVRV